MVENLSMGNEGGTRHMVNINFLAQMQQCLQIADLISWSTYRSIEYGNDEYLDLIKNITIKRVYED